MNKSINNQFGPVVAIVGSRDFPACHLVTDFVKTLPYGTIIVSGGAAGVDKAAEHAAQLCRLNLKLFTIDSFEWNLGKWFGPFRNELIVRYVKRCGGTVVIFANLNKDGEPDTPGSLSTLRHCRDLKCPVLVIDETNRWALAHNMTAVLA